MFRAIAVILSFVLSGAVLAQEAESRAGGGGGGWTTYTDPSGVLSITMNSSVREGSSQWPQVESTKDLGIGSISLCSDQTVWSIVQIYVGAWSNYIEFQMPVGVIGPGFYFQVSTASTSVRTADFEIRPQPTIIDFSPQTAASGQDVTIWGYGFDAFNCVNLFTQSGDSYYNSGDIPAQMWADGTIHFTVPQSMFVRNETNGLVGQVALDSLKEVSLQICAGSDGWNAGPVTMKIVTGSVNIAVSPNDNGEYIFVLGRENLRYTLACDNVDSYTLSLVKTKGTKMVVPLGTWYGYTDFSEGTWAIPDDVAPGSYMLVLDSGNHTASTAEITIKAPLVAPQIVTLTVQVPASPVGLEIKFPESSSWDSKPEIVNIAPERFGFLRLPQLKKGIWTFQVYDVEDPFMLSKLKKKLTGSAK